LEWEIKKNFKNLEIFTQCSTDELAPFDISS